VFLCGEGRNELGSRCGHPAYQTDAEPGVLHALLQRIEASGWEVGGARDWTSIRKYKAGAAHRDTHNVLGVALDAKEASCDVLAFSRDVDNDPMRKDAVEEGIRRIPETFAAAPAVIGGVAVPTLEAWILALLGERHTEDLTTKRAALRLEEKGVASKDGRAMVRIVENADLDELPRDAASLAAWLARAAAVLPAMVAKRETDPQ
jgi:hypothetical protein